MSGRVAARSVAIYLAACVLFFGGAATASAQYQVDSADTAMPSRTTAGDEPFGLTAAPVTEGDVLTKWNGVVADIVAESDTLTRCRTDAALCQPAAQKFLAVVTNGLAHDGRARLGVVNRAINLAIIPTSDLAQWGKADRWSTPLATFTTGRGDCEDYAIAKYVALEQAGVSANDLRLVILRDLATGEDHAIVTARSDGKWLVLDNRRLVMLEDTQMPRVLPLFVLGKDGVSRFETPAMAQMPAATAASPSSLGNEAAGGLF
jgi:predicted transglutaminase-like cysteine proteinase